MFSISINFQVRVCNFFCNVMWSFWIVYSLLYVCGTYYATVDKALPSFTAISDKGLDPENHVM